MAHPPIQDGTWTLNVRGQRGGVWRAWLTRSGVLDPRFQRARFTLASGQTISISADQLRLALRNWLQDPNAHSMHPVKIDLERSTFDGVPVEIDRAS